VSEGVVDALEVIDVGQEDAERVALAARPAQLAGERYEERAAVEHSGQGVARRLHAESFARGDQLGVQREGPGADAQPGPQFNGLEGLRR
jgi:hypothetical protein